MYTVKYVDKNTGGVIVTKKVHIKHQHCIYKGVPDFGICGNKNKLEYTMKIKEVTCLNCLRELSKYRPWKQEAIACGSEIVETDYPEYWSYHTGRYLPRRKPFKVFR
jgi:hypothetical protein